MTWFASATLGLAILLLGSSQAKPAERAEEPFQLVRSLRALQDQSARGSSEALRAQQQLMKSISAQLAAVEPERWKEPRNSDAATLYVLTGGDAGILPKVLGLGGLPERTEKLMRGALAYAEGRNGEAGELLLNIDARSLDSGIAGTVALIQSALVAKADPVRAIALLDEARLLSPGTLVEEAALRREILLLSAAHRLDRLESLLARYIRRFGKSAYAPAFWRQLAAEIAALELADEPDRLARLAAIFEQLDPDDRGHLYLVMAQEGLARGKVGLTRFAAEKASAADGEKTRAQLYEAAALIVTDEYDRGLMTLAAIDPERLSAPDAELLKAALAVAHRVRSAPDPALSVANPVPQAGSSAKIAELSEIGLRTIARAQTVVASVDAILSGTTR